MIDDAFVTTAFIGTAQQPDIQITTGTAVDALTQELLDREIEQKLLLSAGARAIYLQAGRVAATLTSTIQPCEPETLPPCTPAIASLLGSMLDGEFSHLLPEALMHVRNAGQRVPHTIVDAMLNAKDAKFHGAIYLVLGKRGLWLSQFNPVWSWVFEYQLQDQGIEPVQAERIWQEGTEEQRAAILHYLRSHDPVTSRQWLTEVWGQEKAETRSAFLATFQDNLSRDDEMFLEKVLDDRSTTVRSIAANLLLQLPSSALSKRMREYGNSMLSYAHGKLDVQLPAKLPKDWIRDGIIAKPETTRIEEHVWWFSQVLSKIPPSHWEEHFGIPMPRLIAALKPHEKLHETFVSAWFTAASLYKDARWCMTLWDYGRKRRLPVNKTIATLLSHIPQNEAEWRVLDLWRGFEPTEGQWSIALLALPVPWSKEFSETYLQKLRSYLVSLDFKHYPGGDSWYQSMQIASLALSARCFRQAVQPWKLVEAQEDLSQQAYIRRYWEQQIMSFVEAIRVRQRIIEEIV